MNSTAIIKTGTFDVDIMEMSIPNTLSTPLTFDFYDFNEASLLEIKLSFLSERLLSLIEDSSSLYPHEIIVFKSKKYEDLENYYALCKFLKQALESLQGNLVPEVLLSISRETISECQKLIGHYWLSESWYASEALAIDLREFFGQTSFKTEGNLHVESPLENLFPDPQTSKKSSHTNSNPNRQVLVHTSTKCLRC